MTIGERLFSIMKEKNISMPELSRMTGISRHTIYDWQRRNTNPGADKIMVLCEALQITTEELLIGKRSSVPTAHDTSVFMDGTEIELVKEYQELSESKKRRLLAYMNMLQNTKEKPVMERNAEIVVDNEGKKLVKINAIRFKGKRGVNWNDVEEYLRQFVGDIYEIADSNEMVYIGSELPDEYAHSKYTAMLKGTVAKAKANASQGIPELVDIAINKSVESNRKTKHSKEAMYGWYRYDSRFALPVFGDDGAIERYNIFRATMLMRHAKDGKVYLYDVTEIKKETDTLFGSEDLTQ